MVTSPSFHTLLAPPPPTHPPGAQFTSAATSPSSSDACTAVVSLALAPGATFSDLHASFNHLRSSSRASFPLLGHSCPNHPSQRRSEGCQRELPRGGRPGGGGGRYSLLSRSNGSVVRYKRGAGVVGGGGGTDYSRLSRGLLL